MQTHQLYSESRDISVLYIGQSKQILNLFLVGMKASYGGGGEGPKLISNYAIYLLKDIPNIRIPPSFCKLSFSLHFLCNYNTCITSSRYSFSATWGIEGPRHCEYMKRETAENIAQTRQIVTQNPIQDTNYY